MNRCPARRLGPARLLAGFAVACTAATAPAMDNRLLLLQQDSWENHRGFYVALENNGSTDPAAPSYTGTAPLTIKTLRLGLGAADGKAWHFAGGLPDWKLNHAYHVKAVIAPTGTELFLDGQSVGKGDGVTLAPDDSATVAALTPDWAYAPTDYAVDEQAASITSAGQPLAQHAWDVSHSAAQRLFVPQAPWTTADSHPQPGQPLTLEVTFTLQSQTTDLHTLAPFVDKFGQDKAGTWPGKIATDAQLAATVADEQQRLAAYPAPTNVDPYGGNPSLGWHETPTGFYRVTQHAGVWWLITPTGLPCFYTGLCNAPLLTGNGTPVTGREFVFEDLPAQTGPFAAAWSDGIWNTHDGAYFAFDTANLIRKFGDAWREKAQASTTARMKALGFSGLGKWAEPYGGLPYVAVLQHPADPSTGMGKLDVFDPVATQRFHDTIAAQIAEHRKDPLLVGWSVGNEMAEIVRTDEMAALLQAPTATPLKIAVVKHALGSIYHNDAGQFATAWHVQGTTPEQLAAAPLTAPTNDAEPLRRWYADAYYHFIYQTVKSLDTDHLYLGFWIVPGWWMNDSDWALIAPYCDVIGYDHYDPAFADAHLTGLMASTHKPVLCGEFSFPPSYQSARGLGVYAQAHAADDPDAGVQYQHYVTDAAHNPYCVGTLWFEYRDEPITGRGPVPSTVSKTGPQLIYDEHYAFGIVDVTDQLKWGMVDVMRSTNLNAAAERNGAIASPQP